MSGGKWGKWCRTAGHPAECSCTYPEKVSAGKGEPEKAYPK